MVSAFIHSNKRRWEGGDTNISKNAFANLRSTKEHRKRLTGQEYPRTHKDQPGLFFDGP